MAVVNVKLQLPVALGSQFGDHIGELNRLPGLALGSINNFADSRHGVPALRAGEFDQM
jgi:hypothetical protein